MRGMSFRAGVGMALVGVLAFSAIGTTGTVADAAEVKVLTSVALTSALDELAPQFERATGNKLAIDYSLIANIRKRILEGESADVIILSRPVMNELKKQVKFAVGAIAILRARRCRWRRGQARRSQTSVRSMRSSARCSLPNQSSMLIPRRAAPAGSILRVSSTGSESPSR